jgi:hypothetical protein
MAGAQANMLSNGSSVPPLFRLTLISITKQREPMRTEIPAQRHDRRSRNRHQEFELNVNTSGGAPGRARATELGSVAS